MRMLMLLLLCLANAAQASEFTAKIIAVLDGDTVLVRHANTLTRIRLAEIDAPEVGHAGMNGQPPSSPQPYGEDSKQSLAELVLNRDVRISSSATDDYGRLVAHLYLGDLDVNAEQLRRGMAWEYSFHHRNRAYVALQQEAQQAQRGLWAQADPEQPGLWRKAHPSTLIPKPVTQDQACGSKLRCSQMSSCEEAQFYLAHCNLKPLDGDGDGKACESLCAERAGKQPPQR